jgi:hypothetical protein
MNTTYISYINQAESTDTTPKEILESIVGINTSFQVIGTIPSNLSPRFARKVDFEINIDTISDTDDVTFRFEGSHDGDIWFPILSENLTEVAGETTATPYSVIIESVSSPSVYNIRIPITFYSLRILGKTNSATGTINSIRIKRS